MSIADKLTYLNETKRQLREAINAVFGAGLTESDSFRSYADFLNGLWTPDLLFNAGQQGAWFDPSDLSTLFRDAAGTTPVTADGDPVGLMLDKSGNGNHATQTAASRRPVYRTDGELHWLEFDGVDDELDLSNLSLFSGVSSATYESSLKVYPGSRYTNIFGATTQTNSHARFSVQAKDASGEVGFWGRRVNTAVFVSGGSHVGETIVAGGYASYGEGVAYTRVGRTITQGDFPEGAGATPVQQAHHIRLGGYFSYNARMDFYGAIMTIDVGVYLDRLNASAYLATKAGITL